MHAGAPPSADERWTEAFSECSCRIGVCAILLSGVITRIIRPSSRPLCTTACCSCRSGAISGGFCTHAGQRVRGKQALPEPVLVDRIPLVCMLGKMMQAVRRSSHPSHRTLQIQRGEEQILIAREERQLTSRRRTDALFNFHRPEY